jgi:hypothetical protein
MDVPDLKPLVPGQLEFVCTGCGAHVSKCVDDGFDYPVCHLCQWLENRPQIDAATVARLRGTDLQNEPEST